MPKELMPCPACDSIHVIPVEVAEGEEVQGVAFMCQECDTHGPTRKDRAHAAREWNALPRHLTWTKARPTKPGFYFVKTPSGEVGVREVHQAEVDGELCLLVKKDVLFLGQVRIDALKGHEWAGPIPEPMESV